MPQLRLIPALFLAACAAVPAANAQALYDEDALRAYVSGQVAASAGDLVSRFDVKLGAAQSNAALAPCARTEPFLPAGARLWGRSSVGVRCTEGATWSLLVPVTVSAWGRAIVAAAPLAAGTVLGPQDLREQELELTREGAGLARDAAALAGRTLTRAVNPGQPMRADMVRVTTVVQAGDPVQLRIVGPGFAVTSAGQALTAAGDGQSVRVRTNLGKILTGIAREGRQVEVRL
jgi:flagellar basal body P-ring formation protein FlgA